MLPGGGISGATLSVNDTDSLPILEEHIFPNVVSILLSEPLLRR
jgi:hypothetical protein